MPRTLYFESLLYRGTRPKKATRRAEALMNVVDLEISTAVKTLDSLGRDHGPDNVTVLFQSFRVSSVDRAVL